MPYPLPTSDKDQWQYKPIDNLLGGIDTSKRGDQLAENQCSQLLNVLLSQGTVVCDTGYKLFAGQVVGIPQGEFAFKRISGDVETMLVTTRTLYKYDAGSKNWHVVKGTAGTTLTAVAGIGATAVNVTSAVGFSTGDLIGIALDNGDQHVTTITVAGTVFTLAAPMPGNASSTAVVVRAVALAGDLDHQVSADIYEGNDWWVFTNGVDIVKRYDGADCVDVPGLPSAGNVVCKVVAVYNAALFLLNTVEGGTAFPYRVRRSDQADPTNWTTGTAGKDDLLDTPGIIVGAKLLGPYIIVYKDISIVRGRFIGASGMNYSFDTMVTGKAGDGAIATNAILDCIDFQIVVGQHNVYKYRGDYSLEAIGDPIFHKLFGKEGNLNPQRRNRVFAAYVNELEEIWIAYPSLDSDSPDTVLRYNLDTKAWHERKFANTFIGWGLFENLNVFSWDDLIGSWDDQTWTWDSQVQVQQAVVVHLCQDEVNQVVEYDYNTVLDNATPIEYIVETKDFLAPDVELRFDMLEMMIRGMNIQIQYSTDEGRNWSNYGVVNNPAISKVRVFKQFVFQKVRFRWSGIGPNFQLDWIALSYRIESLW